MGRVYRMKFVPTIMDGDREIRDKNEAKYAEIRERIFNIFLEYGCLGTGWYEMDLKPGMSKYEIETRFNELVAKKVYNESDRRGTIQASKIISAIEKDDLIWVMEKGDYYLFKVSENGCGKNWKDKKLETEKEFLVNRDIGNIFYGKWVKVGKMVNVPGIIVNSMGIGGTFMHKPVAPELSQLKWNELTKSNYYPVPKLGIEHFWNVLTDRQIEGLVLLYIQFKYDCMVNTESLKHSTPDFECQLLGKDGKQYYPQVKSGATSIDVEEYYNLIKSINKDAIALVFCENENYGNFTNDDLVLITKNELWNFIKEHENIISDNILQAASLIDDSSEILNE